MWTAMFALIPVVVQVIMEVWNQESKNPAPGQGAKKKQTLMEILINFITNSNVVGKLIGDNQNPTMKLVSGFANLLVDWANDTKAFKKTHNLNIEPAPIDPGGETE
jgi:hypothetical protein